MDTTQIGGWLLNGWAGDWLLGAGSRLLYRNVVRRPLVWAADRWLRGQLDQDDVGQPAWRTIRRQRTLVYLAVLHTVDRAIARGTVSPQVARVVAGRWGRALIPSPGTKLAVQRFRENHGCDPPWFLVIGPGHACNLHCPGCYADSGPGAGKLAWSTLDRLMAEAKALWGVPLFVFSGGEPLIYRSEGKDLLDLVAKHHDSLFLMFTNGTLIDRTMAARLAELGNVTPALSVEGLRARTDRRRGAGMFDRVLAAMASLRGAGVPFGISATVTRENCEEVLSDEFLDLFFDELWAFYGFLFQYTPIGREADLDAMPGPAQRVAFWRRSWEVVASRRLFLLDFWNHGPLVEGCISAGRERGYLYIDWHGNVMPCVFAPYAAANINQVYSRGGTLNDVWTAPFFETVRQWQREHGYGQEALSAETNWLQPCPFRDHHGQFREWIERFQLEPEDEAARAAMADPAYAQAMVACAQRHAEASQAIWENEYLGLG